ncbi:hypothetical protein [Tardiphaga robiniae]|uniref:Uncharacterized protein n=1 Tax=Tardiphaga robiniae TaxID=943830 RepID=A0A7G6U170_9BRAD|nr:hypothetical protein [Tardiphaga robiniae]QND72752.1 hypothetical protein HB776_17055 [Tardiphaga robiniae]
MLRNDITSPLNAKPASLRVQRADSFNTEVWIPAVSASIRAHDQACHAGMLPSRLA